jgi:2-hydroxychromene-2-carboxylate isomerase
MADPIDFYFDFSSPFGYFAATRLPGIAERHGRDIVWRPILLGLAFKITGVTALPLTPLKGDYARIDMERISRLWKIPFNVPSKLPIASQAPARITYWLESHKPDKKVPAIMALFHAFFVEDRDISDPEVAADVVASVSVNRDALLAATQAPEMKKRAHSETEAAIERGVFGSPFFIVDGEPFWGSDRLEQVDKWLETGGF